jgi:hypothetical protein
VFGSVSASLYACQTCAEPTTAKRRGLFLHDRELIVSDILKRAGNGYALEREYVIAGGEESGGQARYHYSAGSGWPGVARSDVAESLTFRFPQSHAVAAI